VRTTSLVVALALALGLAACGSTTQVGADDPRGDTNGRMFDFVSTKPDGDEWTIRIRGDSMWVAFSTETKSQEYDPVTLSAKEAKKVWKLIDRLDLAGRDEGEPDEEYGSVLLRLREPTGEERNDHEIIGVHVPRDTEDDDVIDLAGYLIDLVERPHDVAPAF
jgi:hypothetical protein